MQKENPYSIYAVAHTDQAVLPFNNRGRTVRIVFASNIETQRVSVRFANYYGDTPLPVGAVSLAPCDKNGSLHSGSILPVTVEGKLAFELAPGEVCSSNPIDLAIFPGDHVALSIYYPGEQRVVSGNRLGNLTLRSKPGNYCVQETFPAPDLISRFSRTMMASGATAQVTTVCEIIAQSEKPHRVLACFGDSITQQGNWTVPLQKLLLRRYPGQVSLCNLGIGGNRLLHASPPEARGAYGPAGVERFERDVLGLHGLHYVVLALGLNDIGLPGTQGAPEEDLIDLPQYRAAMEGLALRLHQKKVAVYAATLTPRSLQKPYDGKRESVRCALNDWIKTAGCFDAVLDFDKVLRREDGLPGMKEQFALPDGLHPSPLGGLWMAKSIDLSLFGGESIA
ncbi:GDSL-type esterase/lipase family protein [Ruminococcaceae bacterium OttesenSCG-928-I18]|nr:GDSL-type esterase/lipase family protein [Ruminococcaceae bacterium OttesenSCG-928-I18]